MTAHPASQPHPTSALLDLPEDPNLALIFPGQGAQKVGMGSDAYKAFPLARELYVEANEVLDLDIASLCFNGPDEALTQTENAQPALLVTSLAYLVAALAAGGLCNRPAFMAGHSLGQYTALVAAGAISFREALGLVRLRGELMAEAGGGTMAAVLGLDEETVEEICREAGAEPANYNISTQTVIGGGREAIDRAVALARGRGGKALLLNVSGAFHTSLMKSAASRFAEAVTRAPLVDSRIPVVSNVSGLRNVAVREIRENLAAQLTNPVRWRQTIEYLLSRGVTTFIEVGPGNVLTALLKRGAPAVSARNINSVDSLKAVSGV